MDDFQFAPAADAPATPAAEGTGERVIEIGWQALLLPVVAVAVVAGGWLLGRTLGRGEAPAPAPAAVVETVPQAPSNGITIVGPDGQPLPINIAEGGTLPEMPNPDTDPTIYPLRAVSHPLLDQPVPDFTLRQLDTGEDVNLSDFAGKTVLVNFWATWCPPCRREMPWLQKAHDNYKDQGLVLLAVDGGEKVPPSLTEETIKRYVDQTGLTFPILWGDAAYQIQNDWNVYGLPATFIVDTEGIVRLVHTGMFPNNATLDHEVRKVMGLEEASS